MQVTVKLFATLREGRGKILIYKKDHSFTGEEVIKELKIDKKDAAILLINGRDANLSQILEEGDTISIFPPIGGG